MRSVFLLTVLALVACGKPQQAAYKSTGVQSDSAKLAAHMSREIFGPIWPHDSACFVWLHAEVAAGHLQSSEDEAAANAFAHCTDTAELEARKHRLTAERRATMKARRALGLSAEPSISAEKKD